MQNRRRVKVVGHGPLPPKVVDAETGEPIHGIADLHYDCNAGGASLVLKLVDFDIEIDAEAELKPFRKG